MSAICAMVPTTMNRKGPAPMKTIVVSLLKGGVGKTFLATHLAWYLSEQGGNRVAFLDLDPQGSSTRRLARSEEHTTELQSLMRTSYAVFCFKKNKQTT